jgi:hypothetical protein
MLFSLGTSGKSSHPDGFIIIGLLTMVDVVPIIIGLLTMVDVVPITL